MSLIAGTLPVGTMALTFDGTTYREYKSTNWNVHRQQDSTDDGNWYLPATHSPMVFRTMRIIGGKWKSRKLQRPATDKTRPFPDRVKEAVFSMLGAHYETPGRLPPINVGDVFAGSGTLGLEALSRGATSCRFFERGRMAINVLRENLDTLEAGPTARIVTGDAWRMAVESMAEEPMNLVLLDPPYRQSADSGSHGPVMRFLNDLDPIVPDHVLVVFHHKHQRVFEPAADTAWQVIDQRRFGTNGITVFEHA
jgi:16S rRNA (guanine966-N2)-methyltransferase